MNNDNRSLAQIAANQPVSKPGLHACWYIVVRAIEYGILDMDEINELVAALKSNRDYCVEEFGFENINGKLRVSFLDETVFCTLLDMILLLEHLQEESCTEHYH